MLMALLSPPSICEYIWAPVGGPPRTTGTSVFQIIITALRLVMDDLQTHAAGTMHS